MLHEQVPGHLSIRGRTEFELEGSDDRTMIVNKPSEKVFAAIDPQTRFVRRMTVADTWAQGILLVAGTKPCSFPIAWVICRLAGENAKISDSNELHCFFLKSFISR